MNLKYKNNLLYLCIFLSLCCATLFLPPIRNIVIDIGEYIVKRNLTRNVWHGRFFSWGMQGFVFFNFCSICILFSPYLISSFSENNQKIKFLPDLENRNYTIIFFCIFVIISLIRFYWINQKCGFHEDEFWGIGIANRNEYGFWGKNFELNRGYTGKEIKEASFFDNSSAFDVISDLFHLWIYNKDGSHTSLYYSLYRLWFIGCKTCNMKYIAIRGCLLNFVFFMCSFYFMLLIVTKFVKERISQCTILFIAFLNPASIGISIFLRPYALQETFFIIFSYLFLYYLDCIKNRVDCFSKKNFIISAFITSITISTGYYSLVFVGLLGIIVMIYLALYKKNNKIIYFIYIFFIAIILAKCLYINYGLGIWKSGNYGRIGFGKFLDIAFIDTLKRAIVLVKVYINSYLLSMRLFLVLLVINVYMLSINIYYKKNHVFGICFLISILSLIWCIIIMFLVPDIVISERYIAPVFALLSFCFIPVVSYKNKVRKILMYGIQIIFVCLIFFNSVPVRNNFSKIRHLNDSDYYAANPAYNKDISIPVFIHQDSVRAYVYPYLSDEQIYYFVESEEDLYKYDFTKAWFVYYKRGASEFEKFVEKI